MIVCENIFSHAMDKKFLTELETKFSHGQPLQKVMYVHQSEVNALPAGCFTVEHRGIGSVNHQSCCDPIRKELLRRCFWETLHQSLVKPGKTHFFMNYVCHRI